jgi:hypothetical protein
LGSDLVLRLYCAQARKFSQAIYSHHQEEEMGVLILEAVIAIAMLTTALAGTTVSAVKIRAAQNTDVARMRLRQVANAAAAAETCNATSGCVNSAALMAQIPNYGTVQTQGYIYSMVDLGGGNFAYTAVPVSPGFTGVQSFYISDDAILRCGTDASAAPCN